MGFDFQQKLSEQGMATPAIVITASDGESVREWANHLGALTFFQTPVDYQAPMDVIWWAIDSK
jgi:FixJ family two-component response regulator